MTDQFRDYMDGIKAGDELKEKTKNLIMNTLANTVPVATRQETRRNTKKTRLAVGFAAMAACMTIAVSGYAYYNTPTGYISLDINPSVELGINAYDRVVSAADANQDGAGLLEKYQLKNMPVEEAICDLVREAATQEYIAQDGSTVIAVTALSQDSTRAQSLQDMGETGVNNALREENSAAVVYKDSAGLELRTEAQKLGISPGKLKLIQFLQTMDPAITVDQYKDAKITEIILKAQELIQANTGVQSQSSELGAFCERVQAAVSLMQANMGAEQMLQNQVRTQTQNQAGQQSQSSQGQSSGSGQSGQGQNQYAGGSSGQGQNGAMTQDQTQSQNRDQATVTQGAGNGQSDQGQNQYGSGGSDQGLNGDTAQGDTQGQNQDQATGSQDAGAGQSDQGQNQYGSGGSGQGQNGDTAQGQNQDQAGTAQPSEGKQAGAGGGQQGQSSGSDTGRRGNAN